MDIATKYASFLNDPNTTLGQVYAYLKGQNFVPSYKLDPTLIGTNESGNYTPSTNSIELAPAYTKADFLNALQHETTHAGQTAMAKQRYAIPNVGTTTLEDQFRDAYHKILGEKSKLPLGNTMSPAYKQYRNSPKEYLAFGAADIAHPPQTEYTPVNPHVNATAATENDILIDLARRLQKAPTLTPLERFKRRLGF